MHDKPSRTTFRHRLDDMVQALRDDILTGKLQDGEFLPSIPQLSKQYKLSVNSVQKGLDQLARESLIDKIPRVGIRVKRAAAQTAITLNVGYYPSMMQDAELMPLIESFQRQHPHIRVQTVPLQYENFADVVSHHLSHEILDVIPMNDIHFNQFTERHADLAILFEPVQPAAGIYPELAPAFTQNGTLFVQPIIFSPVILTYNMLHFAERGVPEPPLSWTWHDFIACLEQLEDSENARLAFYFYPATKNRWPIFMLQSGVTFGRDRSGNLDMPVHAMMDGIQTCYDLIQRQPMFNLLLSEQDLNVEDFFARQKVSVMMTTYFKLNKLRGASFPFAIAPLPYVHVPKTLLLTIGLAVNRRSRHKEAAKRFVEHMASYNSQLHIRRQTYSLPALREAAEWQGEELFPRPARFGTYRDIAGTYALLSDLSLKQREMESLMNAMNMYWMGIAGKEETLARLAGLFDPTPV